MLLVVACGGVKVDSTSDSGGTTSGSGSTSAAEPTTTVATESGTMGSTSSTTGDSSSTGEPPPPPVPPDPRFCPLDWSGPTSILNGEWDLSGSFDAAYCGPLNDIITLNCD